MSPRQSLCSRTALPIWYINPVTGDNRLFIWGLESLRRVLTLVLLALLPVALAAQAKPAVTPSLADESLSRWDIFLGYSYLAPDGTITGTTPSEFGRTYGQINLGEIVSVSRYFNRYVGLQAEGDLHQEAENFPLTANNGSFDSNDDFAGASGGVIFRFPLSKGMFCVFRIVFVGKMLAHHEQRFAKNAQTTRYKPVMHNSVLVTQPAKAFQRPKNRALRALSSCE